jgi:hypothetical protein
MQKISEHVYTAFNLKPNSVEGHAVRNGNRKADTHVTVKIPVQEQTRILTFIRGYCIDGENSRRAMFIRKQ